MLDLNKKLQDARLEQERTMLSRQIEATDASIDKLVYELYGLTEEEIKVVGGKIIGLNIIFAPYTKCYIY